MELQLRTCIGCFLGFFYCSRLQVVGVYGLGGLVRVFGFEFHRLGVWLSVL
jgi:hypothetical protein